MKNLPIGISTLADMIHSNYVYVDKTAYLRQLVTAGKYYFLSRPRRFGKSLLVDTFQQLFAGNESIFRGLAIHTTWDWSIRFPVIHLSFGAGDFSNKAAVSICLTCSVS